MNLTKIARFPFRTAPLGQDFKRFENRLASLVWGRMTPVMELGRQARLETLTAVWHGEPHTPP